MNDFFLVMNEVIYQWFSRVTKYITSGVTKKSLFTVTDVLFYILHAASPVWHYNDVIMSAMASQITSLTIVYSTVYSGRNQRKHQSSKSLPFVQGIYRWPENSPHKGPVARKMFPFDDVIMECRTQKIQNEVTHISLEQIVCMLLVVLQNRIDMVRLFFQLWKLRCIMKWCLRTNHIAYMAQSFETVLPVYWCKFTHPIEQILMEKGYFLPGIMHVVETYIHINASVVYSTYILFNTRIFHRSKLTFR